MRAHKLEMLQSEMDTVNIESFYDISDGHKNYIINGNFDIWQRGSTQSVAGYGSDDRWYNNFSGATVTFRSAEFTTGQTYVPYNPKYHAKSTFTSAGTSSSFVLKQQRIEDVRTLSGETATVSFWVRVDTPKYIAIEFIQNFGSGGSPSSTVYSIGSKKFYISQAVTWTKIEYTVDIPSTYGKTIGTTLTEQGFLGLNIWLEAGSNYDSRTDSIGNQSGYTDISQVKLEKGSFATPFIPRSYQEELALCERYYCKSYSAWTDPGTLTSVGCIVAEEVAASPTFHNAGTRFKKTMRSTPTITIYSPTLSSTTGLIYDYIATTNLTVASVGNIGMNGFSSITTTTNFTSSGNSVQCAFHYTADAEL